MSSFCQDFKTSYEHLRKLTAEFTVKYSDAKELGDLREVKKLQSNLQATRDALFEYLPVFVVPNAKNPHHEALVAAGLDLAQTQEQQEMTVDIRKEIQRQLAVYRETKDKAGNPCLEEWVKDITENQGMIYAKVAKDPSKIKKRIRAGMVPVVMPGKSVQMRTWKIALARLKPICAENGMEKVLNENHINNFYKDTPNKMTETGFFYDTPDRPYIVWTKPTQETAPDTRNKAFAQQQDYYKTLVKDHPDLYDDTDLIPTEFIALQAMHTLSVLEEFKKRAGETAKPIDLAPLDYGSVCCFLSAGTFYEGMAPSAEFFFQSGRVEFMFTDTAGYDKVGFRPASRT